MSDDTTTTPSDHIVQQTPSVIEHRIDSTMQETAGQPSEQRRQELIKTLSDAAHELHRVEDCRPINNAMKEVDGANTTYNASTEETSSTPGQTLSGINLDPTLPADRVLNDTQRNDLQYALQKVMTASNNRRTPATMRRTPFAIDGIGEISVNCQGGHAMVEVDTQHNASDGTLTTASVLDCEHHEGGRRNTDGLSSLDALGDRAAQLEADLIETGILMLQGRNEMDTEENTEDSAVGHCSLFPYGRRLFSKSCYDGCSTFTLCLVVSPMMNNFYKYIEADSGTERGIPVRTPL